MTGEEFRSHRAELGKSVEQVAADLGVSKWLVYSWENGNRKISEPHAKLFCAMYGVVYKPSVKRSSGYESAWLFPDYPEEEK